MTATFERGHSERVFVFNVDRAQSSHSSAGRATTVAALEKMLEYLDQHESTATLTPLDGSDDETVAARPASVADLAGEYLFRAESQKDSLSFQEMLDGDSRVHGVYRPPSYRIAPADKTDGRALAIVVGQPDEAPWDANELAKIAAANAATQWGLERCGFRDAQSELDEGKDPGPIVMIDNGRHLDHPELQGVIDYNGPKQIGQASIADHASSVAAIMSARRREKGRPDAEDVDGCCPAQIELFNIWTRNHGVDHAVLYNALKRAIMLKRPVINMSIWLDTKDHKLESLLKECADNDVTVVAAIGNAGTTVTEFYPATDPNVIAVAGTDPADRHYVDSITGPQAFIAAPAENILTVVGDSDYERLTGTSYAAPFVSAAVWLAKRSSKRHLTNSQMRWLLAHSVEKPGQARNSEVGYGRLDMRQLVKQLDKVPSPEECAAFLGEAVPSTKRMALR